MSEDEPKKLKVVFMPGCFDGFDGTQEELDDLVASIHQMVEDGTLMDKSHSISVEEMEEFHPELIDMINDFYSEDGTPTVKRTLN